MTEKFNAVGQYFLGFIACIGLSLVLLICSFIPVVNLKIFGILGQQLSKPEIVNNGKSNR